MFHVQWQHMNERSYAIYDDAEEPEDFVISLTMQVTCAAFCIFHVFLEFITVKLIIILILFADHKARWGDNALCSATEKKVYIWRHLWSCGYLLHQSLFSIVLLRYLNNCSVSVSDIKQCWVLFLITISGIKWSWYNKYIWYPTSLPELYWCRTGILFLYWIRIYLNNCKEPKIASGWLTPSLVSLERGESPEGAYWAQLRVCWICEKQHFIMFMTTWGRFLVAVMRLMSSHCFLIVHYYHYSKC